MSIIYLEEEEEEDASDVFLYMFGDEKNLGSLGRTRLGHINVYWLIAKTLLALEPSTVTSYEAYTAGGCTETNGSFRSEFSARAEWSRMS